MNTPDTQLDSLYEQILALSEQGVPVEEIVEKFPEQREIVLETVALLGKLTELSRGIVPKPEGLSVALGEGVPQAEVVTDFGQVRYDRQIGDRFISNKSSYVSMSNKWKLAIPLVAAVLVIGGVALKSGKNSSTTDTSAPGESQSLSTAADSGNGDDLAAVFASMDADQADETALAAQSDDDAAVATSDSQVINDYGNAYDENSF